MFIKFGMKWYVNTVYFASSEVETTVYVIILVVRSLNILKFQLDLFKFALRQHNETYETNCLKIFKKNCI